MSYSSYYGNHEWNSNDTASLDVFAPANINMAGLVE